MPSQRWQRIRQRAFWGAISGLGVALAVILMWAGGLFTVLQLRLSNLFYLPLPTTAQIVLVAIDDQTLQTYGALTRWTRQEYAALMETLTAADARLVAFDLLFAEPQTADESFAQAIQAARAAGVPTVLAAVGVSTDAGALNYNSELVPVASLAEFAAHIAYANALPDADGTLRRQFAYHEQPDGTRRYSFSVAAYLAYYNLSSTLAGQVVSVMPNALSLPSGVTLPLDARGLWLMNYFGGGQGDTRAAFPVYPLHEILAGEVDAGVFTDKIVLVGLMDATGAVDRYPAPTVLSGDMLAGIEIQAHALQTLLSNVPLSPAPTALTPLTVLIVALLSGLLCAQLRWYLMWVCGAGLLLAWFGYASVMFSAAQTVVNPLYPPLAILLTVLANIGVRISQEIVRRQRAESLLASLLAVAEQRLSITRIMPLIVQDIRAMVPTQSGAVALVSDGNLLMSETWGDPHSPLLMGLALKGGHTVIQGEQLAVPVVWQGRTLAIFGVLLKDAKRVRSTQRQLERFAARLSPNLDNALLYAETQRQNQLLQSILSASPAGILVLDADLALVQCNAAAHEWLNIDSTGYYKQPLERLLQHSRIAPEEQRALLESLRQDRLHRQELRIGERTYQLEASTLPLDARRVVTLSDISDIAELNRLKTRMIRMASHDLKNPLGRIMGYAEMLLEDAQDAADEDTLLFIERIVKSAEEMQTIITDILDIEHLRSGKLQRVELSLPDIVQHVVERFKGDLQDKHQTLQIEMAEDLPALHGDFNLLVQSVSNLVSNAVKYTPEQGTITLRLYCAEAQSLRLEVEDNGYGMPEDAQKQLFTEFYRVRTDKTKNIKGTGLGLSLVKSVVEAHGGKIWVKSTLDVGTTFYVEFPLYSPSLAS